MSESASLGDLLAQMDAFILGKVNVSLPATIIAYNPATQTATVQPVPAARRHDPDTDALIPEALPQIANVPVVFPSGTGGAYTITWPLAPGDPVLLVVCDRSTDEYRSLGAPATIPLDIRRFDLTDAVAIPGYHPPVRPILPVGHNPAALVLQAPQILLGSSAAVSPVALSLLVDAVVSTLQVWLAAHTHSGVTTGPAVSGPPVVPPPIAGSVAALKVRAE
jgi:hypothetical protein